MIRVLSSRTIKSALARVNKRLDKLDAEWELLDETRAFLLSQLPLPLPEPPEPAQDGPALPQGVASGAEAVSHEIATPRGVLVDVAECLWAAGLHQHRVEGDQEICLAPKEQWKKP